MERGVERKHLQRDGNLYGVDLLLSGEHAEQDVVDYIRQQEKTHLAEGLALQQRSIRTLPYTDGKVRGFGGRPMTDINQVGYLAAKKQYLAGDKAAEGLMRRRQHDRMIAERSDQLMADGKDGDGFMVVSPYAEEWDDATADRLGMWPQYRRSYVWFYRKKNASELECVDVSVDQSSLATYKRLMGNYGYEVAGSVDSHDMPAHPIPFQAETEQARNELIQDVLKWYKSFNDDPQAKAATDCFEAVDFIDTHAKHYLQLIVSVHKAIAYSLQTGSLHQLIRLSASRALQTLDCLDSTERETLHSLLATDTISTDIPEHRFALSTLILAQRYGIWNAVSDLAAKPTVVGQELPVATEPVHGLGGSLQITRLINHVYANTNAAAAQARTMPGCAGGTTFAKETNFLRQTETDLKDAIFNKEEKYDFDKKMFCLKCQAPPKSGETEKMCGPCGICQPCDTEIRAENAAKERLAAV